MATAVVSLLSFPIFHCLLHEGFAPFGRFSIIPIFMFVNYFLMFIDKI